MRKSVVVIVCTVFASITLNVIAHEGKRPGAQMREVVKQLSLSDLQKRQLREIMQTERHDNREERRHSRDEMRDIMRSLATTLDSDSFNETEIRELLERRERLSAEMKWQRAERQYRLYEVLDDNQRQALNAIMTVKRNARKDRIAEHVEVHPHWEERMLANSSVMQAFLTAEQQLIGTGDFSREAWESLYLQHRQAFIDSAVEMARQRFETLQSSATRH